MTHSLNEWINEWWGCLKNSPATPGLLKRQIAQPLKKNEEKKWEKTATFKPLNYIFHES